jgi:hypothetical protein
MNNEEKQQMIKYFINEEKRQVIGLLEGTQWDAYNKISKMIRDTDFCVAPSDKYMMPNEFRAVVQCDPADEFNVAEGKRIAKKRILDRYYASFDNRINKFREAVLVFNGVVFDTPAELENNT